MSNEKEWSRMVNMLSFASSQLLYSFPGETEETVASPGISCG